MATEAYGVDFWIGRIFLSKDSRDWNRHVIISDIKPPRAKCHNLMADGKMWKHGSMISFKSLAKRWTHCQNKDCFCKQINKREAQT